MIFIFNAFFYSYYQIIFTQDKGTLDYPIFNSIKFDTLFPNWKFTSIDESLDNTIQHYLLSYK